MHYGCTQPNLKRRVGVPRELGAAGPAELITLRDRRHGCTAATVDNAVARVQLDALTPEQVAPAAKPTGPSASCQTETENRRVARSLEARWKARLIAPAEAKRPAALRPPHCRPVPGGL